MVHFGTQVEGTIDTDEVSLAVGMPNQTTAELKFNRHDPKAVRSGHHTISFERIDRDDDVQVAILKIAARANKADEMTIRAPVGRPVLVPGGLRLTVQQLRNDFLSRLGSAAELELQWDKGQQVGWYFADAPDLDGRLGTSPWTIELVKIEGSQVAHFGLRVVPYESFVWAGWILILIGLILTLLRSSVEVRV
jgi:hypothetical protein